MSQKIIVLGAGVIGLTIAHHLSEDTSASYDIEVVARELPTQDDMNSQMWATPWAGANWSPIGGFTEQVQRWELETVSKWFELLPTGLTMVSPARQFYRDEKARDDLWFKDLVRDFAEIPKEELPAGYAVGFTWKTVSINPETYIPWLKSQLDAKGVTFTRKFVRSLDEAAVLAGPNGVVVNATSLGARSLIGVQDLDVYPIRGQTIHVYAPSVKENLTAEAEPDADPAGVVLTYVIPRPGPADTILIGGTYQANSWDLSLNATTAEGIFERCAKFLPVLKEDPRVKILAHGVGLRPARKGGPRVEVEWVSTGDSNKGKTPIYVEGVKAGKMLVVHAYGFAGAGYQGSWGAAAEAVKLLKENISKAPA